MDDEQYEQAIRRVTQVWVWTVPVLFLVLVLLGLAMRVSQAGIINPDPRDFYAVMTLHGLGMVGTAFVAGFAGVTYLLARYARVSLVIAWTMYGLTILGVVGLVVACLIGQFGPGWYLLYPLPFLAGGAWPDWAAGLAVLSLIVLGVAWLLGQIDVFRALVTKYGLSNALAWQYLRGESATRVEIPPIVLISAAGCLVPGILTMIDGAVLLMLYLFKWFSPSLTYEFSGSAREKLAKAGLWLLVAGAYGFLFMFYLGGALGVLRFAAYSAISIPSLAASSERIALIASAFVVVLIVGLLFVFGVIYGGLARGALSSRAASSDG